MTTNIVLDRAFVNPGSDTPFAPDTESSRRWTLNASDLVLADGATVSSWIAQGPATLAERTFSASHSGWGRPTYSDDSGPSGTPAVEFNGSQQLRMATAVSPVVAQPITIAGVFRVDDYAGSTFTRLWGGTAAGALSVSANGGSLRLQASNNVSLGLAPQDWFAAVFVLNGSASYGVINRDSVSPTVNIGTGVYNGGGLGGSTASSATPGTGLVGACCECSIYTRAFNLVDAQSWCAEAMISYGIGDI